MSSGDERERPEPQQAPSPDGPPAPPELPAWARQRAPNDELSDARMQAYFGPKWETTYRRKLAPFLEDPSFVPTWNWPAAIAFPPAWFLYRKLYFPFALFFLVPQFVFRWLTGSDAPQSSGELMKPENAWLLNMTLAVQVATSLAAGGTANWFLFRRARAASRLAAMQGVSPSEELGMLRQMGGVNRSATTLFLLLMVVLTLMLQGG